MTVPPDGPDLTKPAAAGRRWAVAEVALIFLVFFLYAGGPPPEVNEAHYLAKAKHYWNPAWCTGDHFLESADAHQVFYWTFGWLTLWLPLPAVAWVGRVVTWGLLAWAWRRLSATLVPQRLFSVLSASLFVALLSWFHMAGEWVVGGVEAKGFAYVLLLLGLEALVRDRWNRMWLLLGAASSFHVLAGGWAVVAAGLAWLIIGNDRPPLRTMLPALAGGFLLALPGLLPALALTWGEPRELVRQANEIYVFQRLAHHLVFHRLPHLFIGRHLLLVLVWIGLWWLVGRRGGWWRLNALVAGAVVIAVLGAILDQATLFHRPLAASLLRYYWFRLSDALVPLGTALAVVSVMVQLGRPEPGGGNVRGAGQWLLLAAIALAAWNLADTYLARRQMFLPGAVVQGLPPDVRRDPARARAVYAHWRQVCQWVDGRTEPDALLITPRWQQTFKWYAGRGEVVSWKDVPQDAAGLVEWRRRFGQIYPPEVVAQGLPVLGEERLVELAWQYGARYILIDRTRPLNRLDLPRVYPQFEEQNSSYAVYLVPPPPQNGT